MLLPATRLTEPVVPLRVNADSPAIDPDSDDIDELTEPAYESSMPKSPLMNPSQLSVARWGWVRLSMGVVEFT